MQLLPGPGEVSSYRMEPAETAYSYLWRRIVKALSGYLRAPGAANKACGQ
jgi:hypothetical protein